MTLIQFFRLITPDEGVHCFAAIADGKVEHVFLDSVEDLASIGSAVSEGAHQYYTPATFKEQGKRTQANACKVKSFWLDIDAGKGDDKSYATQEDATTAVDKFITDSGLPEPLRVNSGNGVHLYWPMDMAIVPETWKPIAARLQALAQKLGLLVDTSCTTDSARLLRYPGSLNYRDPSNPKPTGIINEEYEALSLFDFAGMLGLGRQDEASSEAGEAFDGGAAEDHDRLPFAVPEHITYADDGITKSIVGTTVFKIIVERSDTCAQIAHIRENRANLPEPLWRAGLSIAQICEDREYAIEEVSKDHSGYTYAGADKKAAQTNGPYTCQAFERIESEHCQKCPHKGRIATPAQLGRYIEPAVTEADRTVDIPIVETIIPTPEPVTKLKAVIPEYPSPYFRPKGGVGVHKVVKVSGEPDLSVQICEYDFYVTRRMNDPDVGEVLWFRVHLPLDGIREFSVPLAEAVARDKLRDILARYGIMATDGKQVTEYLMYVKKWLRHLQMTKQAEKVRSQMGWTEDGTFVVGTKELVAGQPEGQDIIYAPPAARNTNIIPSLTERGDFHKWKEVINFYDNEDMEAYAFAMFLSFGAPLMQFTNLRGGVYNLVSEHSGIGKSSALLAANSIWGHPFDLLMQKDDTYNVRIHRAGVMRHLPLTIDEITNMKPLELSDQVYASTSGRGKNRMETHTNTERLNLTSWQTPTLTTSNSSVSDKLFMNKSFPEGELMRVIEVEVQRSTKYPKAYTDMLFPQLEHNYGMAWLPYMRYVMNHQSEVIAMLRRTQEKTDAAANLTQRERIWSTMAAIGLTGGTIAHSLGLHNINVEKIARWVAAHMFDTSKNITQSSGSAEDHVAAYMSENYNNLLMIRNEPAVGDTMVIPIVEPRGELLIRCEPDTRRIFIASGAFKKWCAKNQVNYSSITSSLTAQGIRVEIVKKRMSKGTAISMPPMATIMIQIPDTVAGSVFGIDEMDKIDEEKKAATLKAFEAQ
tara:strand:+ start:5215 stop:8160 length:2946 start_codon:yes stop_codon:yes gene_type:complete